MKKRTLLIAAIAFGLFASNAGAAAMQVSVNGKAVAFNTNPVVKENITMVQFAPIFRSLGISFSWNQQKQQVTAVKGGSKIILTVGSRTAYVNGRSIRMQQAPVSINGNIFVPLRFVSEAVGAAVNVAGSRISILDAQTPSSRGSESSAGAGGRPSEVDSGANKLDLSEEAVYEYLITHYDTLYTTDTGYEVDYLVTLDDEGNYNAAILLDSYEQSGSLYAETKFDGSVLHDLTGDLAFDLEKTFGLDKLYVHVVLAPMLDERPAGIDDDILLELEDGSWMLLQNLFVGVYDFKSRYSEFYDLTIDDEEPIALGEW